MALTEVRCDLIAGEGGKGEDVGNHGIAVGVEDWVAVGIENGDRQACGGSSTTSRFWLSRTISCSNCVLGEDPLDVDGDPVEDFDRPVRDRERY